MADTSSEPTPRPPADPRFGDGRCGRAAQRLWDEHVERFAGTPFGLSIAEYGELQERAERCRRAMPDYGLVLCGGAGQAAWVECFMRDGWACKQAGKRAIESCRRSVLGPVMDDLLGGHLDRVIDLDGP